jgi:hypothetical protein
MKVTRLRRAVTFLCLISIALPSTAVSQQARTAAKFELTIDSIMRGPDLAGYEPNRVYWSQDSKRIYFRWKKAGEPRLKEPDLYVVNRDGSGLARLTEEEAGKAPPPGGDLSKDKKMTVFSDEGDIYIYDHVRGERRRMTSTVDGENNPRFTGDQKHIVYVRQNNLYRVALDGSSLEQLTDIRTGGAPPPEEPRKGTESQEYVKKEERTLIEAKSPKPRRAGKEAQGAGKTQTVFHSRRKVDRQSVVVCGREIRSRERYVSSDRV